MKKAKSAIKISIILVLGFLLLQFSPSILAQSELSTQLVLFSKVGPRKDQILANIVCKNETNLTFSDNVLEIYVESLRVGADLEKVQEIIMAYKAEDMESAKLGNVIKVSNTIYKAMTLTPQSLTPGQSVQYSLEINLLQSNVKKVEDFRFRFRCLSSQTGNRDNTELDTTEGFVEEHVAISEVSLNEEVVYRFFNKMTGTHLYTTSISERDTIIGLKDQWLYEGAKYIVYSAANDGRVPVFRFFNKIRGTHLYTTSVEERDQILQLTDEWTYEGTKFYVYNTKASEELGPVFRFFNTRNGGHLFTISQNERDTIQTSLTTFSFEGEKYFVKPLD